MAATETKTQNTPRAFFSLFRDWRLLLYNFAILLLSPYLIAVKLSRGWQTKSANKFVKNRCISPLYGEKANPGAIHLLFIGTGSGEKQAADKLIPALKKIYPHLHATFAAKDQPTVDAILASAPEASVTFFPFDFWLWVAPWYKKLNPDVVISLRKLWLPNIIWGAKLWGASVCVIGAPSRTFKPTRNQLWAGINRWTLRGYDAIGFISAEEKENHRPLFSPGADVRVTGPTRFLQPQPATPPSTQLAQWIKKNNSTNIPIFIAGSLHLNEIEFILDAYDIVRDIVPCKLLIAPRRLAHIQEITDALRKRHLTYLLRSASTSKTSAPDADVLVLDTMGELSCAYSFACAAYVGGTLSGVGHNIYEPLEWCIPVYFGSGNGKIHASQKTAAEADVGFRVKSSQELSEHWIKILKNPQYRKALETRCITFIANQQEAFEKNLQLLVDVIEHKHP